jgi:indole-3-glycerol phosphate synthase
MTRKAIDHLAEIIAHKRTEIEPLIEYTEEWKEGARKLAFFRGFIKAVSAGSFGFIVEVKRACPSVGLIAANFDPVKIAVAYDTAGADCISVLTDNKYFRGRLRYLAFIRSHVPRPVLRKDFILHEVQLYEAALAGADAVSLMVAALNDGELTHLVRAADDCGIDALVEVHDEPELKRALNAGGTFIGINNRNLTTFQVDLRTTEVLANLIPADCVVISESGIRSVEDVRRMMGAGVDGVLIGESLMRAQNPQALLESFREATLL